MFIFKSIDSKFLCFNSLCLFLFKIKLLQKLIQLKTSYLKYDTKYRLYCNIRVNHTKNILVLYLLYKFKYEIYY